MKNYMLGMGASKKSMFKSRVFKHLIPQLTQNKLKQLTVGSGANKKASDDVIERAVEMSGEGSQKRTARHAPLKFKF
jgi:hypothetical protein